MDVFVQSNTAETLVGGRIVDQEGLLVQLHPAEETLMKVKLLAIGGAHHRADQCNHRLIFLPIHEGNNALLRSDCLQGSANDRLHDLLRIEGNTYGAGEIVEDRELFDGSFESIVLLLKGFYK